MINFRLAKNTDYVRLADVHMACSVIQPGGFMFRLGLPFLRQYYRVMLQEKYSVILCAEEDGKLLGFSSGSLDTAEHFQALKRHRLRFLISVLAVICRQPRIIKDILARMRSGSPDSEMGGYVTQTGPRGEFWCWLSDQRYGGGALVLNAKWLLVMKTLGAKEVRIEVDGRNPKVERMHRLVGARVVKNYVTPDGNPRIIMGYDLTKLNLERFVAE